MHRTIFDKPAQSKEPWRRSTEGTARQSSWQWSQQSLQSAKKLQARDFAAAANIKIITAAELWRDVKQEVLGA
jgi:hypothetical protein